jgi:hypothetical protein
MDNRRDTFVQKFSDALGYLGSNSIHDLVSIKYRDSANPSDYREFIGYLQSEPNLDIKQVEGDFQSHAWLVTENSHHHKALLVEHETGLEILYIAGSIASLLSLLPLISSGWKFLHSRFSDRPFYRERGMGVEIRIIDSKNQLLEQNVLRIEDYILSESMKEITALKERVEQLERELKEINENKAKKSSTKRSVQSTQKNKK